MPPSPLPASVTVRGFGAVGDGSTDDTAAVQTAIDEAASAGGGRVVVDGGGRYRCGSIELKTGVELHLEGGSRLVAASTVDDFSRTVVVGALNSGVGTTNALTNGLFLWAENARDIAVTGTGVIDGSAGAYVTASGDEIYEMDKRRPFPLFFIGCSDVVLRDVRFEDAALWTVRLSGCDGVLIDGIVIRNDMRVPNADGIDLDHCKRVRVVGCDIITPDDGISLKTTDEFLRYGGVEDIVITGCTVQSRSTAITVGVDTDAPLRNIVVSDCVIRDSHRGVSVSVGTGTNGYVENVLFANLVIETRHTSTDWWGCGEPIVVRSAPWHDEAGAIRRVRFSNILARGENGVLIHATDPGSVHDVLLSDVRIELARWTAYPGGRQDLRPLDHAAPFPGEAGTNGLRAITPPGILIENADDVRLRDVEVAWGDAPAGEYGAALDIRGSRDISWSGFRGPAFDGGAAILVDGLAASVA